MNSALRSAFAQYFLQNEKALVITHENNYNKLNDYNKDFAIFLVTADGYLKVNYTRDHIFYIGGNNLHKNFNQNFVDILGKCCRPQSWVDKGAVRGIEKELGRIPYRRLLKYRLVTTFNRDDYWFDSNGFTVTSNYALSKRIRVTKTNIIQPTDFF